MESLGKLNRSEESEAMKRTLLSDGDHVHFASFWLKMLEVMIYWRSVEPPIEAG
jgi:hypothetical protein